MSASVELDRSSFEQTLSLMALRAEPRSLHALTKKLSKLLFKRKGIRPVQADPDSSSHKLLLLVPSVKSEALEMLTTEQRQFCVEEHGATPLRHKFRIGYEHMNADEVLHKLLPEGMDAPASFETVGHIAHLNLRDEHMPYKKLIGQVLLDKNPNIRTVVTKLGTITNVFRTFPMEVIAGAPELDVVVKAHGAEFRFNFADVYWNSRLDEEHMRVVDRYFRPGDIILDAFCGVGPFAVPAAQRGCFVYANDLNPKSYESLVANVKRNKVANQVECSNLCARTFMKQRLSARDPPHVAHIVMNLPNTAIEFLDALRGTFSARWWCPVSAPASASGAADCNSKQTEAGLRSPATLPMVHCYCFSSEADYEADVRMRVEAALGVSLEADAALTVRMVRDVAPNKLMLCAHFRVPASLLVAIDEGAGGEDGAATKRQRCA